MTGVCKPCDGDPVQPVHDLAEVIGQKTVAWSPEFCHELAGHLVRSGWRQVTALRSAVWAEAIDTARQVVNRRQGTYEADIDLLALENPYGAGDDPQAQRIRIARAVAEHWHAAACEQLGGPLQQFYSVAGHSLGCVLSALDGETDPAQLGVAPEVLA